MKKTIQFLTVAFGVLLLCSFNSNENKTSLPASGKGTYEEAYYVFLTIDGQWSKEKKAYVSKILYYPGYESCEKESYRFIEEAEKAFRTYLKAEYKDDFPYNVNNIISWSGKVNSSASEKDIKTKQQAQESLNNWAAEQKNDGNTVIYTVFGFSCDKN